MLHRSDSQKILENTSKQKPPLHRSESRPSDICVSGTREMIRRSKGTTHDCCFKLARFDVFVITVTNGNKSQRCVVAEKINNSSCTNTCGMVYLNKPRFGETGMAVSVIWHFSGHSHYIMQRFVGYSLLSRRFEREVSFSRFLRSAVATWINSTVLFCVCLIPRTAPCAPASELWSTFRIQGYR